MKFPFVENRLSVFSRTARQSDGSPKPAENAETTVKALVAGGDPRHSDALDLKKGVLTLKDPKKIAA